MSSLEPMRQMQIRLVLLAEKLIRRLQLADPDDPAAKQAQGFLEQNNLIESDSPVSRKQPDALTNT